MQSCSAISNSLRAGAALALALASAGAPAADLQPAFALTTASRPAKLADYGKRARWAHQLCVEVQRAQGLPTVPFVTLPPDFVIQRTTTISDGSNFYEREESFVIDIEPASPGTQCRTGIKSTTQVTRRRGLTEESMSIDEEGKRGPVQTVQVNPPWHRPHDADRFTAKRTVHGIALKCLAAGSPDLSPGVVADLCVVDAGRDKDLRSMSGRLLSAYLVDELLTEENGVRILEPISLTFDNAHSAVLSGPLR